MSKARVVKIGETQYFNLACLKFVLDTSIVTLESIIDEGEKYYQVVTEERLDELEFQRDIGKNTLIKTNKQKKKEKKKLKKKEKKKEKKRIRKLRGMPRIERLHKDLQNGTRIHRPSSERFLESVYGQWTRYGCITARQIVVIDIMYHDAYGSK
jgi:hypothetical protein